MMNIEMFLLLGLVGPGVRMGRVGGRRVYGKVSNPSSFDADRKAAAAGDSEAQQRMTSSLMEAQRNRLKAESDARQANRQRREANRKKQSERMKSRSSESPDAIRGNIRNLSSDLDRPKSLVTKTGAGYVTADGTSFKRQKDAVAYQKQQSQKAYDQELQKLQRYYSQINPSRVVVERQQTLGDFSRREGYTYTGHTVKLPDGRTEVWRESNSGFPNRLGIKPMSLKVQGGERKNLVPDD